MDTHPHMQHSCYPPPHIPYPLESLAHLQTSQTSPFPILLEPFSWENLLLHTPKTMGNFMQTCMPRQPTEKTQQNQETQPKTEDLPKENRVGPGNKLRIKIVLTKEELDWLVFQLKFREGKSLEDVLEELERGRGKGSSWKPSLQSITENPEVPEIMDR